MDNVLERYKRHEYNTTPQVAALITIAELLKEINTNLEILVSQNDKDKK